MRLTNRPIVGGLTASLIAISGFANMSQATVISASSSGHGASANLSLLVLNLQLLPAGQSQGFAPGTYSNSNSALSASASAAGLASLSTGVLTGTASSNVNGGFGVRSASGSGRVDGASATVIPATFLTPAALTLSATTIRSTATVSGDYGALSGIGSTIIEGLQLSILGQSINIGAFANPNTVLFNSLGIKVVLNEQITSGNGTSSYGMSVNAIHISFLNAVVGTGLLNGDIYLGHSEASMFAAVPGPGAAGAFAAFGGLAAVRRRRRA